LIKTGKLWRRIPGTKTFFAVVAELPIQLEAKNNAGYKSEQA